MPKITLFDPNTGKPVLTVEDDNISLKKIISQMGYSNINELLSYLTAQPQIESKLTQEDDTPNISEMDKVKLVLTKLLVGWHRTNDIKEAYERIFKEKKELSFFSTYMKRLEDQGILERRPVVGTNAFEYRVSNEKKLNDTLSSLEVHL